MYSIEKALAFYRILCRSEEKSKSICNVSLFLKGSVNYMVVQNITFFEILYKNSVIFLRRVLISKKKHTENKIHFVRNKKIHIVKPFLKIHLLSFDAKSFIWCKSLATSKCAKKM